eukprot:gene9738-13104_t
MIHPFKSLNTKNEDNEPEFDLDVDETEVLKRYHTVYKAFVAREMFPKYTEALTERDIGRNIQNTLIDFSVSHALQGSSYIAEIQTLMQYLVLQSALILTIDMPLYINPIQFKNETTAHVFSAVVGFAAISFLACIIACTILSGTLNMVYSAVDGMIMRVKMKVTLVLVNIINYLAIIATITAMLLAGFDRSYLDGYVQLYGGAVVIGLFYLYYMFPASIGTYMQDVRAYMFYKKYCKISGELKEEYLKKILSVDAESKV